ncbi:hypothetical protein PPERSA_03928 [Pseudocohnilembus persalinus]|uniref:Uncharacterized protein n=1 Tax=Pseudocohnilembus persalinus TaxID=266149 RepID=A0A0V0R6A2_PSEPJ|nr:hypothetical protein PPERSA_03928 [Pseudocohnilembus persalinus]|eukprot:KRX09866.1 hypothetical protein PPERSA_03928 [Pseudocohnilembus persalinus]
MNNLINILCEAMVEIARIDEEKYTDDKKLEIAEKVQKMLQKTQMGTQSEYQAMVYKFESEIYLKMGQQQKSLDCLEKCCNFHIDLRNFEIGLDFLLKAKQRWEYIDPEEVNLSHIYLIANIGIGYTTQGDMKQGMPYLDKAIEKLQPVTQENVQMFVFTCQHMAKLRLNLDQIEESLKITQECWEYMHKQLKRKHKDH